MVGWVRNVVWKREAVEWLVNAWTSRIESAVYAEFQGGVESMKQHTEDGARFQQEDRLDLFSPDEKQMKPRLHGAVELSPEEVNSLAGSWSFYLHFYLGASQYLAPREKRALILVEVEGLPYRFAAERLGLSRESLKILVHRARCKVFRIMSRSFVTAQAS